MAPCALQHGRGYHQLYPTAHSFLGYIDYVGRQNIISPNAGLTMTAVRDLTLSLQQYFFWRASDRDALYNKSGVVLRPGTETTARYIGAEVDLLATYNVTRHLLGYGGYSHFFTGDFIRKTGPSKDSNFFYTAIQYTFWETTSGCNGPSTARFGLRREVALSHGEARHSAPAIMTAC